VPPRVGAGQRLLGDVFGRVPVTDDAVRNPVRDRSELIEAFGEHEILAVAAHH
jgi:hypothetical protein